MGVAKLHNRSKHFLSADMDEGERGQEADRRGGAVCVAVLCGLPGSGKTALALQVMRFFAANASTHVVHIEYDTLIHDSRVCT